MVQGPLVSSLGETVAVSTFTPYSMVRAEISCRNVNASRCHTALQHIDDSEVWSTFFLFSLIKLYIKADESNRNSWFFNFTNGRVLTQKKIDNFSNLIIFDQKAWSIALENAQNLWFLYKNNWEFSLKI